MGPALPVNTRTGSALEEFRSLYNQHWLIEHLGFEPPVRARQLLVLQPAA